jgi:hypothetical protein
MVRSYRRESSADANQGLIVLSSGLLREELIFRIIGSALGTALTAAIVAGSMAAATSDWGLLPIGLTEER